MRDLSVSFRTVAIETAVFDPSGASRHRAERRGAVLMTRLTEPYRFKQFAIRPDMMDAIYRYIYEGLSPGHFLTSIIDNDLREAVRRADEGNMANLPAFVAYFHNEAPWECWGSPLARVAWLARFQTSTSADVPITFSGPLSDE